MAERPDAGDAFARAVGGVGPPLLRAVAAIESAQRRLHPAELPALRAGLAPLAQQLGGALTAFEGAAPPAGLADFAETLRRAAEEVLAALRLLAAPAPPAQAVSRVLESMRRHARAQELLFPLRRALPPVDRFFAEPACHGRLDRLDPDPPTGLRVGLHAAHNARHERGGFSLYVPEAYDGIGDWPLVVALHGGGGHGADFLWTWLREARSRRCLLLAPTARGSTWSLHAPELDGRALRSMVAYVGERWKVDRRRILLTGLSDGATFALLCGLSEGSPFTALAPISGVLHPANFARGNFERARGRPIYLVHGALDWMFPVALARLAADELARAGADLTYREIPDLSHTYPREENARILAWLAPERAPGGA